MESTTFYANPSELMHHQNRIDAGSATTVPVEVLADGICVDEG
jgi:hypothetical protein